MGARYLVDGYCLDEAVAFKLYVSKMQPTVINDALIFPELAGNQLSFSTVTVDLSAYLQRCDGDFYAAGAADFYSYYPVFIKMIGICCVLYLIKRFTDIQTKGGNE